MDSLYFIYFLLYFILLLGCLFVYFVLVLVGLFVVGFFLRYMKTIFFTFLQMK